MGEREGPEFGCWFEDVDEAVAVARGDFGAVGETEEVVVAVDPKTAVELCAGGDDDGLDVFTRRPDQDNVAG